MNGTMKAQSRYKNGRGGFLTRPFVNLCCLFLLVLVLTATSVHAADYVYDPLKIFNSQQVSQLTQWAQTIDQATGIELVVASVDLKDQPIEKVAVDLFAQYKVGKAGQDNGLLVLIAPNQRQYRFEVGYGLEGMLPDSLVGNWGRTYLAPAFAKGQYYDGVAQVIHQGLVPAIAKETGKTVNLANAPQRNVQISHDISVSTGQISLGLVGLLIFWFILWRLTGDPFILLRILFLLARMSGGGRRGGGGGWGGGGGRSGGGRSGGGGASGGW